MIFLSSQKTWLLICSLFVVTCYILSISMLVIELINKQTRKRYKNLFIGSGRQLWEWFKELVTCVGICWLLIEFSESMFLDVAKKLEDNNDWLKLIFFAVLLIAFWWATLNSLPKLLYTHHYSTLNTKVCIKVGNILDEKGNIAIGSSNYMDSSEPYELPNSLKGQLINKFFNNNPSDFDTAIQSDQHNRRITGWTDNLKPKGKKERYYTGSVFRLQQQNRWIFIPIIADLNFSTKDNEKINSTTSIDYIHKALINLWKEHNAINQINRTLSIPVFGAESFMKNSKEKMRIKNQIIAMLESEFSRKHQNVAKTSNELVNEISIPVLGSGLAKLQMDRLALIQYIILSYLTNSCEMHIAPQLNIVLYEKDHIPEEMNALVQFLKSLKF